MRTYLISIPTIWNLNFSKQLSHAPLGQDGCTTANAPTESSITESSEPFRIGIQFTSSLLLRLTQGQPATSIRIWQYALYSTFGKVQCPLFNFFINLVVLGIPYATYLSLTSPQNRRFTPFFLCQFLFAVVVSERTTACYVGRHGQPNPLAQIG